MRSRIAFAGILFAIMLILPSVFALEGNTDPREGNIDTSISNDVISLYSQSKALFIENKGQWDPSILYLTIIPSGFIALANDGIYHLHIITDEPKGNPLAKERIQSTSLVKILFKECSPAIIIGNGLDSSYYNFYLGNNSKKWATGVRGYHSVIYENVWDNIDIVFYFNNSNIKYDIILKPHANPDLVRMEVNGHQSMILEENKISILTSIGTIIQDTSLNVFYKYGKNIDSDFFIEDNSYGIKLSSYDSSKTIVIDPEYNIYAINYSTFIGGNQGDIFIDFCLKDDYVYCVGSSFSTDFPTTFNSYQGNLNGIGFDCVFSKFNSKGTELIYSTYFGGTDVDFSEDIEVNENGNIFISGETQSNDFPLTEDAIDNINNGDYDLFFLIFNDDVLLKSTLLGGSKSEAAPRFKINTERDTIVICAWTNSLDFPITSDAYQKSIVNDGKTTDILIIELNLYKMELLYASYFGGLNDDFPKTIDLHSNLIIIGGYTHSKDFNVTWAFQSKSYGIIDGFILAFDINKKELISSSYFGGTQETIIEDIKINKYGVIYACGHTNSPDIPVSKEVYQRTIKGSHNGFVFALNITNRYLLFCSYVGGYSHTELYSIDLIEQDSIHLTGTVKGPLNFSTTFGAFQETPGGGDTDGIYVILSINSSECRYSTYIGGSQEDYVRKTIPDFDTNEAIIIGETYSPDFPIKKGSYDISFNSDYPSYPDGFLMRIKLFPKLSSPIIKNISCGLSFVNLSWIPPPISDVRSSIIHYEISRGLTHDEIYYTNSVDRLYFNDTNVINGITYYYIIRAVTQVGPGKPSKIINVTPATVPDPPGNFVAICGNNMVNLTWNSPFSNGGYVLQGYRIYKFTGDIQEHERFQTGPNILSFSDENVVNGINYRYYMTAFNAMGESLPSVEVNATPRTRPLPVLNIEARSGPQHVLLSWDLPGSDGGTPMINFTVSRAVQSGSFIKYVTLPPSVLWFNDTDVENGVLYRYRVYAVNSEGSSNPSEEISAIPLDRPSPPRNLISESESNTVMLSWNVPLRTGGTQILGYRIYRKESDLIWEMISEPKAADDSYTDRTVLNGRSYLYRITAFNIVGESDPTGSVEAAPIGPPGIPMRFDLVTGDHFVHLIWDIPLNDGGTPIIGFKVYKGETNGLINLYRSVTSSDLSYNDTNVVNGITYHYRVTAVNNIGEGAATETKNTKPAGIPSPPSNVQVTPGDGFVEISWTEPEDDGGDPVTDVKIHRGEDPNSSVVILTTSILAGSFRDMTVTNGVTYNYTLTSTNSIGESVHSPPIFTTPSGKPSVPLNVEIEAASKAISLSWDTPSDTGGIPITGYRIYRSYQIEDPVLIAELGPELNEYVDRDVEGGRRYQYWVSAVNDNGEGPLSDPVEGKVKEDSGLVLVVTISFIVVLLLLLGIVAAVMLRRRGSPPHPDASSPPIPSAIRDPAPGEGEIPPPPEDRS